MDSRSFCLVTSTNLLLTMPFTAFCKFYCFLCVLKINDYSQVIAVPPQNKIVSFVKHEVIAGFFLPTCHKSLGSIQPCSLSYSTNLPALLSG